MFSNKFTLKLATQLCYLFETSVFLTKFKSRGNNNWIWNQVEWKPKQYKSISFYAGDWNTWTRNRNLREAGVFFSLWRRIPSHSNCLIGRPVYFVSAYFVATLTNAVKWWTRDLVITQHGPPKRFRTASKNGTCTPTTLCTVVPLDTLNRMIYELVRIHIKFEVFTVVRSYVMLIYSCTGCY